MPPTPVPFFPSIFAPVYGYLADINGARLGVRGAGKHDLVSLGPGTTSKDGYAWDVAASSPRKVAMLARECML